MTRRLLAVVICAALLGGCGARLASLPQKITPADSKGGGGGKYYLDDGPPLAEPEDMSLADAVVRLEKINPARNRPYTAFGQTYAPFQRLTEYRARGNASWYGRRYHGRKTASGEVYDMFAMTAAHRVLPIPSFARVTRADNGKSAIVRVNDRGPFLRGREIDLSYAAAKKLGVVKTGVAEVWVEAVIPAGAIAAPPPPIAAVTIAATDAGESEGGARGAFFYLQIGAFAAEHNAAAFARRFAEIAPDVAADAAVAADIKRGLYLVRVGPYPARAAAADAAAKLSAVGLDSFIIFAAAATTTP